MSVSRLAASKLPIKIPKYIERGPTDILKALASTVKFVPDQPEACFNDDAYLIPRVSNDRRIFMVSKLSGVKTARFLLNKHPELFYRDDAEPKIELFQPAELFDQNMDFSVDDIRWCIDNNDPANAVIAYKSLLEKNIKLDNETLLQFLEFMCFTNEDNLVNSLDFEMEKFVTNSEEQLVKYTWKPKGLATQVFDEIKDSLDPPRAYSAMISGLSRYNQHTSAQQLFTDFKNTHPSKGLTTTAYNSLLYSYGKICSSIVTAQEAINEIVDHMGNNLVKPNLITFNNIIEIYRDYRLSSDDCRNCIKLLNDMNSLDIQPSLYTFGMLVSIFAKHMGGREFYQQIQDIIAHVESNFTSLQDIRDARDCQFLSLCVFPITGMVNDVQLAKKLHKLFLMNPRLFLTTRHKQRFLDTLFKFIVTTENIEAIMEFYNTYVPLQLQPTIDSYEALTESLDLYQADRSFIDKVGQDLINFKLAKRIKSDDLYKKDPEYVKGLESLEQ